MRTIAMLKSLLVAIFAALSFGAHAQKIPPTQLCGLTTTATQIPYVTTNNCFAQSSSLTFASNTLTAPTITATTKFLAADGTAAIPSISFTNDTDTGFSLASTAGVINVTTAGTAKLALGTTGMGLISSYRLIWTNGIDPTTGSDLFLSRYAAKRLMISGDGGGAGANAGIIAGYLGVSGYGALWSSTTVTPGSGNYLIGGNATDTVINTPGATGIINIQAGNVTRMLINNTAGSGPTITAGTATTDVNALSLTQTWNAAVAFNAIDLNVTNTSSAAGANLMRLRIGGTAAFTVGKDNLTLGSAIVTPASSGTRYLCIDTGGVVTSSASACSGT